jgi:ribonuclease E
MTDEKKPVKKAAAKPAAKKKAPAKKKTAAKTPAKKTATKTAVKKKAAPKKKPVAKKTAAAKKTATKTTAKKKAAPKKAPAKAKTAKKETAAEKKKATTKKTATKTAAKKKAAPKKAPAKKTKAVAKETAEKKETKAKKATVKKAPAKKTKAATKEATEKKETKAKKAPAKKTTSAKAKPEEKKEAPEKQEETSEESTKDTPKKDSKQKRRQPRGKKTEPIEESPKKDPSIVYKLLVNADEPEECRIALLENGKVESFNVETVVRAQTKGNIYKGIITAVEPNLQAAFVDMGTGKNGFLPFSDIHPEYYCKDVGKKKHWKDLSIQSVIMKGQEVLVEVVKETTGNKGANLTTYLSMPGRYVVLMPGSDSHGISRKISNEDRRKKLREIVNSANLPEEIGYIIRTASEDITKTALMKDIRYQLDLWTKIKHNGQTMKAPAIVYKEQNVVSRFLRDHFTSEIDEIMVDNKDVFDKINEFMELLPAKQRTTKVKLHRGSKPIFNQFQVEEQIEQMYQPQVPLPSGGSIVIDPTEALVAIDVNSGRTSKDKNFEKTIFLANMEAADELARQLRLRDLGGLIVVDFIDMRDKRNIREVEKTLRTSLKKDKAKIDTSRISKFGLMQISRQRLGPPIQKGNYIKCEHCQGSGIIKSVETTSLSLLRRIQTGAAKRHIVAIECELPLPIAQYLLNQKRADIVSMERKYRVEIRVISNPAMTPAQEEIRFIKKDS